MNRANDYRDGFSLGVRSEHYCAGKAEGERWAEEDRRNHIPPHSEIALLRDESQTEQRWARAFYLGALRGYRQIVRTFERGSWGT